MNAKQIAQIVSKIQYKNYTIKTGETSYGDTYIQVVSSKDSAVKKTSKRTITNQFLVESEIVALTFKVCSAIDQLDCADHFTYDGVKVFQMSDNEEDWNYIPEFAV